MSSASPNDNNRNNRSHRERKRPKQNQAPATVPKVEQSRQDILHFDNENFPPLNAGTSKQATAAAATDAPFLNQTQPTASSMHEQQPFIQSGSVQYVPIITDNIQPLMPSTQLPSHFETREKPNARKKFPVTMPKQSPSTQSYYMHESKPATTISTHLMQSVNMKPDTVVDNNSSPATTRPLTAHENEVNKRLCEIILTIHESKEYVSRERVQRELFRRFHVNSWHELGVQPGRFNALINLTDRQKDVTFYMHIFEQIFNLCTLNDLEPLVAGFLNVEKYDDLRLGPLDKNPEVQRIFEYKPTNSDQTVPIITTGDVINRFMEFQKEHRHQRQMPFGEFLDKLVKIYELQSREELGIFCRSFPFLLQVTGKVRRDNDFYMQQVYEQSQQELIEAVRTRLNELKEELRDAQELSSFNKKKTPTAVFNHLTSIVDKYLDIVPQQPALYAILVQLRDDELLRCLFNVSIYLGTLDQPEVFIAELKQLYNQQERNPLTQGSMAAQQLPILNSKMSKKDRRKMEAMMQQQQLHSQAPSSSMQPNEQNTTLSTPVNTSFASSLLTSYPQKPKPPVSLRQLCSDIYTILVRYDTVLTIEQLLEIDGDLCAQHGVANFSAFIYDENDSDNNPVNLLSFLDKHRQTIDPHGELSVYEHTASVGDQTELYSFVQQLSAINNDEINEQHHQQSVAVIHGHVNTEQLHLSTEKLSAVERAVKHKFGGSIRKGNQLLKKTKERYRKNNLSIIRFEESLLDVNGLNRLDICPTSLNVDETQLCELILHCPLMADLRTYLQWTYFFQPKYGSLKSFISKHESRFKGLRLLETSNQELFRLPTDATLTTFEYELNSMHIRSAVGHLCALIIQEGLVTRFPFNVYRTSMDGWFHHLRSSTTLQNDHVNPLKYILDFLMYLPVLIGQSRIIEELILRPLDDVFGKDRENGINARTRIWNLAKSNEKIKLELWGYTVNVTEWKNENKWLGYEDSEEKSMMKLKNDFIEKQNIDAANSIVLMTTAIESYSTSTSNATSVTPITTTATYIDEKNDSTQAAFEHIESIRRDWGINSGLDSNGQLAITKFEGVTARLLKKVSTDLYSDQGHFVLELIQNADDNQYIADRLPTLRFILSSERILVCNNEVGFQPRNISAICDVGASTKGKHKQGYAGHKGVGFKSVFMVSHRPEIHSRNYHFRFDTVDGTDQMALIRPIWIDQYEEILPNSDEWTTCIRLPIKKEIQRDRLQQDFDHIQPRLLLFLNRLRQIEIINQQDISSTKNNNRVFTRIDHAQGQIIELQEKIIDKPLITNLWLVIKKVIDVPDSVKINLRDMKGEVDSTTIAIAYPLSGIQASSTQLPPTQPLYAYLPLRPYGFRFILQADFEIPVTRQEICRDNLWNEWLKSEMTCLLSLAYLQFQRLPDLLASSSINTQINTDLTPIQTIKYFLKLIPSSNELDPYFNTFVDQSIRVLMGIIKLPVSRQNEKEETIIDWVLPTQCVIVRDQFIRKILSQDLLLSHFNCYYIHEQLALECDEQIFLKLGCRQLDFTDIARLIEVSYKQDEQEHPKTIAAIEQIAQWLVCLDYSLQQQREQMHFDHTHNEKVEKETISKLKHMKIIPLKDQSRLVSVNDFEKHGIAFPLNKSLQYSKHFRIVLDDIPTLDEQLLDFIEDKYPRRVDSIKKLLRKLGITDKPNFRDIYRQYILPVMSDPNRWSLKSESVLISYLLCIYEYLYLPAPEKFEHELKQLENKMVIKTRDNKFVSLGSPDVIVHLTSTYGSRMSLESLRLTKFKFTFISDDYYTHCLTNMSRPNTNISEFVSFLKELNLNDFLQVESIRKSFLQVSLLVDTQWAYLIQSLSEMIYEAFDIQDYRCEEFNKLISPSDESQTVDSELCIQLLQYLDKHHPVVAGYYAASISLTRSHKFGHGPIKAIESSFCLSLRQHSWIPVSGGMLYKPGDVYFLQDNSETSAFRRYVPHLDTSRVSLRDENFIYNILSIKSQVTQQVMFELLMKWSCDLDSESLSNLINQKNTLDIIPCTLPSTYRQTCLDTIDNFRHIYHFLASKDDTCALLSRFRLWPIIFIPRDQKSGDFLFVHKTFWNDPISLLSSQDTVTDSKGRIPIRPYYDNDPLLHKCFLEILQVELQPTIDDYLPLLPSVQDINQRWQIIEIITQLAMEQNKQQEVREKCLDIAFIPRMDNKEKLVKYTNHPFYPHNSDIAKLFADTLPIIDLPDYNVSSKFKEDFCLLFNIENLGNVIKIKIDTDNEKPSTSLADFYRCSIDLIQHFLINKKLISDAQSNHLSTIFARMQFVCVDRIHLSYCYGTNIVKVPPTSSSIETYIDDQTCKFYILKKYETSEMRYTDAMANFIVEDKVTRSELLSHIKTLLQIYQKDDAEGLAKLREILTEKYEPKWTIPEEIKKDIPVVLPSIPEKEKEIPTSKKPEITDEKLKQLMNEPSCRPKPRPKEVTNEEDVNRLPSFPAKRSNIESDMSITKDPSKTQLKPTSDDATEREHTKSKPKSDDSNEREYTPSLLTSNSNDQNHRVPQGHEQANNEHTVPKNRTGQYTAADSIKKESNADDIQLSKDQSIEPHGPVTFSDSTSLPPPNFESIIVSTLKDPDLFTSSPLINESSTTNLFRPINKADLITGRQGEEIVFQYLKREYPNDNIVWVNEENESGKPYDIHRIIKSENNREEFIEVKTTRSSDQNTFPVSIGEVEYLLKHSSNYFIYRVYYAGHTESSTITVINKIKDNLQSKHLKLSMTIVSKPSD